MVKEVVKEVPVPAETKLKISQIEPNKNQPRKAFDEDALIELDRKMKADDKPSMKKTTVAGIVCYVCAALTLNSIRADIRIWGLFFAFVAVGTFFLTLPKIKQTIKAKFNKSKNKKK